MAQFLRTLRHIFNIYSMGKFKFLMFAFVLAGAAFTSCSKDDVLDVLEADKPVVTVNRDGASITTINDKNAGEIVPVVARFDMGAQQDRLEKIKITTLVGGQTFVVLDSTLNSGWFNRGDKFLERNYNIAVGQSLSTITFETTDVKGRTGTTTITVAPKGTTIPADNVEREATLLAGQLNITGANGAKGGFYSVSIDKVFKLSDAVTNAQFVDFVYYYGDNNKATLSPINDNSLTLVAGIKEYIGQFNVVNATKFLKATSDNYNNNTLPAETANSTFVAAAQTQLSVDDYLAFKTVLGQKGLIRVIAIMGTTQETRAIKIRVKTIK
jgi:hypothetical protein